MINRLTNSEDTGPSPEENRIRAWFSCHFCLPFLSFSTLLLPLCHSIHLYRTLKDLVPLFMRELTEKAKMLARV